VVLFGGGAMAPGGEVLLLDDTWEWDGDDWVRVTPAAVPPPRRESAATYDSERGTVLVFGGKTWLMDATAPVYGDTWTRSRGRWVEQAPATAPDGRFSTALAFDEDRARAVLFGGCRRWHGPACAEVLADTWEWDGVTWQEQLPPLAPSPRHGHVMAYDARRRRVVLFGGYAALAGTCGEAETQQCSDTWEWDGADWIERHPDTVPPGRTSSALAWDAVRGRSTMVGGYRRHDDLPQEAYADTWDWDGVDWQQLDTPAAPVARYDHGLAFDAARGRLVLYGGIGIDRSAFDDTWEWTEAGWTRRLPGRSAGLREGHVLAYDGFEHGVLLFGGTWMGCRHPLALWDCAETWTRGPAAATPHLVVELDIGASNVLVPSPADRSSRRLLAVAVDVAAGGLGHTWAEDGAEPEAIPGYRVSVSAFGHGGWIPLHTSGAASPAAPAAWGGSFDYDWRCGEPWCEDATIDRWLGTDGRLLLALAPLAPQGASPEHGEIALDYVEVRVAYWRTGCEAPHELNPEGTPDGTPCTDGKLETVEETCRSFECVAR